MRTNDEINRSQGFTMGDLDSAESTHVHEDQERQGIKKVEKRLTLLAMLLIFFTLSISLYSYINLSGKISAMQDSGSVEVETVSRDLETKLTALTVEYAKLKYLVDEHVKKYGIDASELDNRLLSSAERFEKFEKGQAGLKKATAKSVSDLSKKIDRGIKDFSGSITKLKKELKKSGSKLRSLAETVSNSGKELKTMIAGQASKYETGIEKLSKSLAAMEKELDSLKRSSEDISKIKLSRKEFAERATRIEKDLLVQLNLTRGIIDKRISAIEARLKSVASAPLSEKKEPLKPSAVKTPETSTGKIVEKNIE